MSVFQILGVDSRANLELGNTTSTKDTGMNTRRKFRTNERPCSCLITYGMPNDHDRMVMYDGVMNEMRGNGQARLRTKMKGWS